DLPALHERVDPLHCRPQVDRRLGGRQVGAADGLRLVSRLFHRTPRICDCAPPKWLIDPVAVRIYAGTGPAAEAAAAEDERRKGQRAGEGAARREHLAALQEADAYSRRLAHLADQLTRASLLAAGFHQHAKSEWRQRRQAKDPSALPSVELAGRDGAP